MYYQIYQHDASNNQSFCFQRPMPIHIVQTGILTVVPWPHTLGLKSRSMLLQISLQNSINGITLSKIRLAKHMIVPSASTKEGHGKAQS